MADHDSLVYEANRRYLAIFNSLINLDICKGAIYSTLLLISMVWIG